MNELSMQEMILKLELFWTEHGVNLFQSYDTEVGAGTMSPFTFLRASGPEPWSAVYVQPSRRPADGRYGKNPNRLFQHHQLQVVIKPSPDNIQELYLDSLKSIGIDPLEHDIRFVEDNWENPSMGAAGIGWEVWLDGMEVSQFTYFQQVGGIEVDAVTVEITYGIERLSMYIQDKNNVWDLDWGNGVKYNDIFNQPEFENSTYAFEEFNLDKLKEQFDYFESEANRLLDLGLIHPAYDFILKTSHTFNLLDASGSVSSTERASFLKKIRSLAKKVSNKFIKSRFELDFPLIKDDDKKQSFLDSYKKYFEEK